MKIYRASLFGHRDFSAHYELEEKLYPILKRIIYEQEYVEFYIGRNGEFDVFTASIIKRAQRMFGCGNSCIILVLPYPERNVEYYAGYYDDVVIPECLSGTHPKGAITKRNRWMIEQSDLLLCYVERRKGGAYEALRYAEKLGKSVINIANTSSELAVTDN